MYTGMCNAVSASKDKKKWMTFKVFKFLFVPRLIPHLYFVHDYWFNRRTVKKYSFSSVCYSDSHFSYIPSNVCIISFPSRKIFCLHFQRLLRLMCYTEISMNFSTTWAPGNSYYRFGSLLMCIHQKKLIACPCWDLQCSPVSQGR